MKTPIMWLIERADLVSYTTRFQMVADHAELTGCTVTPIYSALRP